MNFLPLKSLHHGNQLIYNSYIYISNINCLIFEVVISCCRVFRAIHIFTKEQLITDNIANGLKNPSTRTPQFYISPKIHKEGNPGRPVVSSINCHIANILKYVGYHLQPMVKQIPFM